MLAIRSTLLRQNATASLALASSTRSYAPAPFAAPQQPRAFDLKAFRNQLRKQKINEEKAEYQAVAEAFCKPAPDGWTVLTFLEKMKCPGDNVKDIAREFASWEKFISTTPEKLWSMDSISNVQKKAIWRHVKWFNLGLWPKTSADEYVKRFAGKPMEREGLAWTPAEDGQLRQLCAEVDVAFGDPFLTISWLMQRRIEDVRDRYVEIILKPQTLQRECELAITKASRPLMMNRKFRLDVPFVYVIPTEKTHKVKPSSFRLPANFQQFRIPELFGEKA